MVDRKRHPDYQQVTAHLHKDLVVTLKLYCATQRTTITEAVEHALTEFLRSPSNNMADDEILTVNSASKEESNQLALLILSQLAKGERPSNPDLVIVAEAAGVHTAELIALCDRLFGKGKNSNGVR